MKQISYVLVMIILSVVITSVGCKKKGDDAPTKDQFVGTWQGAFTYTGSDGQVQTGQATITIRLSGESLLGYLSVEEDPLVYRFQLLSFVDGVYTFKLVNSTPEDEDCQNWNVNGTITLSGNVITINMSGIFCGPQGEEPGTFAGNLSKTSSTPEDSNFITFAQVGREWHYRVTGFDGDQCTLIFNLNEDLGNGVFSGIVSGDCEWIGAQAQFWWYVSPQMWCDMQSASLNTRFVNIRADAKVGDVYKSVVGNDSTEVTVLSINDQVIIAGTTYNCYKVLKKTNQFGSYSEGWAWGNNAVGFIKYEAIIPNNPHDVHLEELVYKNF